jgi:hypothetical protein
MTRAHLGFLPAHGVADLAERGMMVAVGFSPRNQARGFGVAARRLNQGNQFGWRVFQASLRDAGLLERWDRGQKPRAASKTSLCDFALVQIKQS